MTALATAWIGLLAPASAGADPPLSGQALTDRISQLQSEVDGLRGESQEISGTRNLHQGVRNAEGHLAGLRVRMDELDRVIEQAGGTQRDLERYLERFEDQSIISESDLEGEAAEQLGGVAARRVLSTGAGRALGWLGLALDAGEYGGEWILRQGDISALEDAVAQNQLNLNDLYGASSALSGQINAALADVRRMREIKARDAEVFPELAALRERQRLFEGRATRGARLDRETDAAGDEEEERTDVQEQLERGIRPSVPTLHPGRTTRPGVSPSGPVPNQPRGRY